MVTLCARWRRPLAVSVLAIATAAVSACSGGFVSTPGSATGQEPASQVSVAADGQNTGQTSVAADPNAPASAAVAVPGGSVRVNGDCANVQVPGVDISSCKDGGGTIVGNGAPQAAAPGAAPKGGCPASPVALGGTVDVHGNYAGRDLRCAAIGGSAFTEADFTGANLSGATLAGGDFSSANFSRANLRGATASGASFHNANFTGADLTGMRFTTADVTNADFTDAICPSGRAAVGRSCAL